VRGSSPAAASLWKPLNHAVLMLTRDAQAAVRLSGGGWYKLGTNWPLPVWTELDSSSEFVQI
jgi:hypothetical protein